MENTDLIHDVLREYAELKIKEKEIKARLEILNPSIREYMENQNLDKIPTTLGDFSLKAVPVWEFSEKVTEALAQVDILKTNEKADGTAKSKHRFDLMFKSA